MGQKQTILKGAFILTAAGFLSRIMGFFYRIFLSRMIGAEGLGLYHLIFPLFSLALALTSHGIQTAISHYVSGQAALGDKKGAREHFLAGLFLSLSLSVIVSFFMWRHAGFLAQSFLKEERAADLLRCLSLAIPFASLHSCATGYFMGLRKTAVPALSQLLEQLVRIFSTLFICQVMAEKGIPITPLAAVAGMVFSECFSALFTATVLFIRFPGRSPKRLSIRLSFLKDIGKMAAPLSLNRLLISFLQSVEAVLIPARLRLFGYTSAEALSHYGVLNGMALPLILFPSAITGAISMMLVPTVAEAHTLNNRREIARTVEATIQGSLILGLYCTGAYFLFGPDLGIFLFGSSEAGEYILILSWICPFLYLGATLTSILNGLGKTVTTFFQSAAGLFIQILFVWFYIPKLGMTGCLLGLLCSQLLVAFLSVLALRRQVTFSVHIKTNILLPVLFLLSAAALLSFLDRFLIQNGISTSSFFTLLLRGCLFTSAYAFLTFRLIRE